MNNTPEKPTLKAIRQTILAGKSGMEITIGESLADDEIHTLEELVICAENGDTYAQTELGILFRDGISIEYDYSRALTFFNLAAYKGCPEAQFYLGTMHFKGEGIEKDGDRGQYWMHRSAEAGFLLAQSDLALRYCTGDGLTQDSVQGWAWAQKAVAQGDDEVYYNIGFDFFYSASHRYFSHPTEFSNDEFTEAARWLRLAARQNHPIALMLLGMQYEYGIGVEQSYIAAWNLYQRSTENGNDCTEPIKRIDLRLQSAGAKDGL